MKLRSVLSILALASAEGSGMGKIKNEALVTECRGDEQLRRCKWDDKRIDLDAEEIILNIEVEGPTITCQRDNETSKPGAFVGKCDGAAETANFVMRHDKKGVVHVHGSLVTLDEICRMRKGEVLCEPASGFPEEDVAKAPEPEEDERRNLAVVQKNLRSNSLDFGLGRRLYDDSGSNLDVLVVWTSEAECKEYGLSPGCTLNEDTEEEMRGLIDLAVAETNTAFANSGINTQLRLVHAYRDETYTEPSSNTWNAAIADLQKKDDGKLDSVHIKRERYGADLVAMIIGAKGACGIGYSGRGIYKSKMFSVTRHSCATGYYSFGHEIAHNAGAYHDRSAMKQCDSKEYNYGWRDPNANFRSIVANSCSSGGCDDNAGGGCPRVQMFSTPNRKYNGEAIGDGKNDNSRVFNDNKAKIAAIMPAMDCKTSKDCDDGNGCTVDTCASNGVCIHSADYDLCAQSCPVGKKNFQLYIQTDNAGHQITWSLVNTCTGSTLRTGSSYGNNNVYNIDECVDENAQYTFHIIDSGKDGLCCSDGYGEYTALYDGSEISQGTSFGTSNVANFGSKSCSEPIPAPRPAPTPPPSPEPSPAPTPPPSPEPSPAPSPAPTPPPSPEPTPAPSLDPTPAPSPFPTNSSSPAPSPATSEAESAWAAFWRWIIALLLSRD